MDLTLETSQVSHEKTSLESSNNDATSVVLHGPGNKRERKESKGTRRKRSSKSEQTSTEILTRSHKVLENITALSPSPLDEINLKRQDFNSSSSKIINSTANYDENEKEENASDQLTTLEQINGKPATGEPIPGIQPSVLQALGLTRGLGIGVGITNSINLAKNSILPADSSRSSQNSVTPASGGALTKTVPLLLNMPGNVNGNSSGVPSILPANLPPGRYVIISSTSASANSPLATITTTSSGSGGQAAAAGALAVVATHTTATVSSSSSTLLSSDSSPAAMPASTAKRAITRLTHNGSLKVNVRSPVGKTRGMRKSYTNSEKLAMIEAVESGLRKSVVADKFGVAPSTLACIILQKEKIRRDQVCIYCAALCSFIAISYYVCTCHSGIFDIDSLVRNAVYSLLYY